MTDPRMTPTNDAPVTVEQQQDARRKALIERIGYFADNVTLAGDEGDVAYDLLRQAAAQISSDRRHIERHRLAALASAPAGDGIGATGTVWQQAYALLKPHLRPPVSPTPGSEESETLILVADAINVLAAALDRPRAAVGEQSREILAATLARSIAPYAKHLAALNADDSLQVGCWIARRQIDDLILALQSPPAKVEE